MFESNYDDQLTWELLYFNNLISEWLHYSSYLNLAILSKRNREKYMIAVEFVEKLLGILKVLYLLCQNEPETMHWINNGKEF